MHVSPAEVGDMSLWTFGAARSEWNRRHAPPGADDKPPTPEQMSALRKRMKEMMPDVKG